MSEKKIVSIITAFQIFFILAGWFFTCYFIKINGKHIPGVTEGLEYWPMSVLFVKEYFPWFVLLSLILFCYFLYDYSKGKGMFMIKKHYILSSLFLGICLILGGIGIKGAVNGPGYILMKIEGDISAEN